MSWRVCNRPGCGVWVEGGGRCRPIAARYRRSAAKRGYGHRWRQTRARFLAAHPTCQMDGCDADATEAHHLDGAGPLGPLGHYEGNLQALCQHHHAKLTARLQPGGWARDGKPSGDG